MNKCNMGMDCEDRGYCYAAANSRPELCGREDMNPRTPEIDIAVQVAAKPDYTTIDVLHRLLEKLDWYSDRDGITIRLPRGEAFVPEGSWIVKYTDGKIDVKTQHGVSASLLPDDVIEPSADIRTLLAEMYDSLAGLKYGAQISGMGGADLLEDWIERIEAATKTVPKGLTLDQVDAVVSDYVGRTSMTRRYIMDDLKKMASRENPDVPAAINKVMGVD